MHTPMQGAEYAGGYDAPPPQSGYAAGGPPYRAGAGREYGGEPGMPGAPGYGYAERQQGGEAYGAEAYGAPQASRALALLVRLGHRLAARQLWRPGAARWHETCSLPA